MPRKGETIPVDYAKVKKMASLGLTQEQVAQSCGFSRRTFANKMNADEKFREAYETGLNEGICEAAQALRELALDKKNPMAITFFLKTRAHWNEQVDVKHDFLNSLTVKHEGVEGWEQVFKKMKPPKS